MKRRKKLFLIMLSGAFAIGMTGCSSMSNWDSVRTLLERARESGGNKEETILQDFIESCKEGSGFVSASEYYLELGETEKALKILQGGITALQARSNNDNEELTEKYFEILAEQGKLDTVRQWAPDLSKQQVAERYLSEYDKDSLLALIPSENISYVDDDPSDEYYYYNGEFRNIDINISGSSDSTYTHYSIEFNNLSGGLGSGKGTGPEPELPNGITLEGDYHDCLTALGFSDEQADILQDYSSVTVYLEERNMDFYVYNYDPDYDYHNFRLNYDTRENQGSIGFNFNQGGLDSYELSYNP